MKEIDEKKALSSLLKRSSKNKIVPRALILENHLANQDIRT